MFFNVLPFAPTILKLRRLVYKPVAPLDAEYFATKEPEAFETIGDAVFKPIKKGERWGGKFDCAWFRLTGAAPANCKGKHLAAVINIDSEGCIYEDGRPVQGITNVPHKTDPLQPLAGKKFVEITPFSKGGEKVALTVEVGGNNPKFFIGETMKFRGANICEVDDEAKAFFYDFMTLFIIYASRNKNDARKDELLRLLKSASKLALRGGPKGIKGAREELAGELDKESDLQRFTFYVTGHAHLDLAWLWPMRETKRKAVRTYTNALKNIEKYDGYIFGSSQPQQFEWMKKLYPDLFERIKEAVKNRRIEPQGGMWVESDTNVPCGESLIRQIYYGKRFFKEEFGEDMSILWLPDVFGFSAQLPQIIKKTGMEYFLTIKLSWNEHTQFPYTSFIWQGLDDSRILAHMPPDGDYNSDASPLTLARAYLKHKDKDKAPLAHVPYGAGDGGGGPGEAELEFLKRMTKDGGLKGVPIVKHARASEFFDELSKYKSALSVHKGELYLEKHQGTLTTQAKNKYYNRKLEILLHNVEFLASAASVLGYKYDRTATDEIWKELLLYQFHDIIPGSSITRVYDETKKGYEEMTVKLRRLQNELIGYIAGKAEENGAEQLGSGAFYAVNASPVARREFVKHNGAWYKTELRPYSSGPLLPAGENTDRDFKIGYNSMSNSRLTVKFSPAGYISSILSADGEREYVDKMFNRLVIYTDKRKHYNAWDIDERYTEMAKDYFDASSAATYIDGPNVVRETFYKKGASTVRQKIILPKDADYLVFDTQVEWHMRHKMLRADFYPAAFSGKAVYDVQFGNIERSTGTKTKAEYAQFEVCGHKWADVSSAEKGFGVSLLNDCKYGHRIKDGLISLNLLRSTVYPDKYADRGSHKIVYAVYPHEKGVFDGDTVSLGYAVNQPLIIADKDPGFSAFALSNKKNIIVETVKPSSDGRGIALRVFENCGAETLAAVKVGFDYTAAYETDMTEEVRERQADLNHLYFKPYEIKTIVLERKPVIGPSRNTYREW